MKMKIIILLILGIAISISSSAFNPPASIMGMSELPIMGYTNSSSSSDPIVLYIGVSNAVLYPVIKVLWDYAAEPYMDQVQLVYVYHGVLDLAMIAKQTNLTIKNFPDVQALYSSTVHEMDELGLLEPLDSIFADVYDLSKGAINVVDEISQQNTYDIRSPAGSIIELPWFLNTFSLYVNLTTARLAGIPSNQYPPPYSNYYGSRMTWEQLRDFVIKIGEYGNTQGNNDPLYQEAYSSTRWIEGFFQSGGFRLVQADGKTSGLRNPEAMKWYESIIMPWFRKWPQMAQDWSSWSNEQLDHYLNTSITDWHPLHMFGMPAGTGFVPNTVFSTSVLGSTKDPNVIQISSIGHVSALNIYGSGMTSTSSPKKKAMVRKLFARLCEVNNPNMTNAYIKSGRVPPFKTAAAMPQATTFRDANIARKVQYANLETAQTAGWPNLQSAGITEIEIMGIFPELFINTAFRLNDTTLAQAFDIAATKIEWAILPPCGLTHITHVIQYQNKVITLTFGKWDINDVDINCRVKFLSNQTLIAYNKKIALTWNGIYTPADIYFKETDYMPSIIQLPLIFETLDTSWKNNQPIQWKLELRLTLFLSFTIPLLASWLFMIFVDHSTTRPSSGVDTYSRRLAWIVGGGVLMGFGCWCYSSLIIGTINLIGRVEIVDTGIGGLPIYHKSSYIFGMMIVLMALFALGASFTLRALYRSNDDGTISSASRKITVQPVGSNGGGAEGENKENKILFDSHHSVDSSGGGTAGGSNHIEGKEGETEKNIVAARASNYIPSSPSVHTLTPVEVISPKSIPAPFHPAHTSIELFPPSSPPIQPEPQKKEQRPPSPPSSLLLRSNLFFISIWENLFMNGWQWTAALTFTIANALGYLMSIWSLCGPFKTDINIPLLIVGMIIGIVCYVLSLHLYVYSQTRNGWRLFYICPMAFSVVITTGVALIGLKFNYSDDNTDYISDSSIVQIGIIEAIECSLFLVEFIVALLFNSVITNADRFTMSMAMNRKNTELKEVQDSLKVYKNKSDKLEKDAKYRKFQDMLFCPTAIEQPEMDLLLMQPFQFASLPTTITKSSEGKQPQFQIKKQEEREPIDINEVLRNRRALWVLKVAIARTINTESIRFLILLKKFKRCNMKSDEALRIARTLHTTFIAPSGKACLNLSSTMFTSQQNKLDKGITRDMFDPVEQVCINLVQSNVITKLELREYEHLIKLLHDKRLADRDHINRKQRHK